MPRKKLYKPRKRPYKKKKRAVSLYQQSPAAPLGQRLHVSTRYFDKGYELNGAAAGNLTNHLFSANGLYDPDVTGVGHQVLGFDQMMLMFDHYVVIGSRIRVDFWNKDAANAQLVGIRLNDDASPSANPIVAIENGSCKYTTLSPFGAGIGARGSITMKCNPAKFLGRSNPLSDPELKGSITSNPTEGVFYSVFVADTNQDDSGVVEFMVTLEYEVIYIEPKELGNS